MKPSSANCEANQFIPGLKLSELYYREAVQPVLARRFPDLAYSAALIGRGSEVLGFDTPQSMDHDWGPRLLLFLPDAGFEERRDEVRAALDSDLPAAIHGVPVDLACTRRSADQAEGPEGPARNGVTYHTVEGYFGPLLNADVTKTLRAVDWLAMPQQYLRAVTDGRVFHDGLGQLEPIRDKLRYYPRDVWLYMLACQWRRIAQEEAFVGRCGQVGDELGSRLVAARLVRDLMQLCFLMERRYAPYIKWFGTAFGQLRCADELAPFLSGVLGAATWQEREGMLVQAYELVARMHNDLGVTESLAAEVSAFHERPFMVMHGDRFAGALRAAIDDVEVRALPEHLGSVDQWVDSTDVLDRPGRLGLLKVMYDS